MYIFTSSPAIVDHDYLILLQVTAFRARNAVDLCVEILVLGSPRPRWEMDGDPVAFVS